MAVFHLFPNLPYELRSQIWRLAIRSSDKTYAGIHQFTIIDSDDFLKEDAKPFAHLDTGGHVGSFYMPCLRYPGKKV